MVTVRPATVADAPAMGQLVVRAWQAAYRGQMPDDYLNGLRAEERAAYWDGVLRREDRRGVILVAERDGEVVGFAAAGPSPDPQGAGELYAINVDSDHWGGGAGRALLGAAQAELDRMGFAESVLWVLPGNARARRFYERAGWVAEAREDQRGLRGQLRRGPLPEALDQRGDLVGDPGRDRVAGLVADLLQVVADDLHDGAGAAILGAPLLESAHASTVRPDPSTLGDARIEVKWVG